MDNTLLDATTPHLRYFNQVSGLHFTNEDVNDFYLCSLYKWEQEERDKNYNLYGHDIHWESLPYPMAIETLNDLFLHHKITIMTARPMQFQEVTLQWLQFYGAKYHDLVLTENKYAEFINLEADVLVDDAPHYAIELSHNRKNVILYHQPYNSSLSNDYISRAASWQEVKAHVENLEKRFESVRA